MNVALRAATRFFSHPSSFAPTTWTNLKALYR